MNTTTRNTVKKVTVTGGLIGIIIGRPYLRLKNAIEDANKEGWRVVQVLPDNSGNVFTDIIRYILLFITLTLWTPANGYLVILEKEDK